VSSGQARGSRATRRRPSGSRACARCRARSWRRSWG